MKRIIYHSVSDYFKGSAKQLRFLMLEDRDDTVNEEALGNLYYEDLMNMVELLPPATKEVFVLYAIEGFYHREIGEKLGISDGTSKWHLSAARKQLKKSIEKNNKLKSNAS